MASPQKENGNTGISNELLERLLLFDFPEKSASPLKLWLFVARKTYGYQKKVDNISLSQFQKGTNLSRSTVSYWLNWLVAVRLLVREDILDERLKSTKGAKIRVNKDYEQWVVRVPVLVRQTRFSSTSTRTHNKYNNNKKNTVKEKSFTPKIKLMEEEYTLEELSYEVEGTPKSKSKYGNRTMAILARKFAEVAGIEIGRTFDASEWAKPLGEIYRRFNKDPDKTMKFFEDAGKWYTDKELTFTPHTLEKNFTMLNEKWLKDNSNDPRYN